MKIQEIPSNRIILRAPTIGITKMIVFLCSEFGMSNPVGVDEKFDLRWYEGERKDRYNKKGNTHCVRLEVVQSGFAEESYYNDAKYNIQNATIILGELNKEILVSD